MRLLVLGGTGFLGFHTTAAALAVGHEVWLFNRGRSRPDVFPEAKRLVGDRRAGDLWALASVDELDAVIDCTGYFPAEVVASTEMLRARAERYVFVSSVSVYASMIATGEENPVSRLEPGEVPTEITGGTYGPLKVACEEAARAAFGDDATIVRPGLIVGPEDPTDRFTYWVRRGTLGGEILAPSPASREAQVVDGRDLGAWLVALGARDGGGTFNALGEPFTFERLLDACNTSSSSVRWTSEEALVAAGVQPWTDLPLWLPLEEAAITPTERARNAGLVTRPIEDTVEDTRAWDGTRGSPSLRAGITREREAEVLGATTARRAK